MSFPQDTQARGTESIVDWKPPKGTIGTIHYVTVTPKSGLYESGLNLVCTVTPDDANAIVYYRFDGIQASNSDILYDAPFPIADDCATTVSGAAYYPDGTIFYFKRIWQLGDMTPQNTIIDDYPLGEIQNGVNYSKDTTGYFRFHGTKADCTYRYSIDGSGFADTAASYPYTLAEGVHTFQVYAVGKNGVADPTPATYTWTIDLMPPIATISGVPISGVVSTDSIDITIGGTDVQS